jgi:AraC-like DNA-binding protein
MKRETNKDAIFLSHSSIYHGDYDVILRNPDCEFDAGMHYHDFYEIQFYLAGQGKIRLNDKSYSLGVGDVVLINIFQPHLPDAPQGDYHERFCIDLDPSFLLAACSENTNLLELFSSNNKNYPVSHFSLEQLQKYLTLFIKYTNLDMEHGKDIMERAILYEVLADLYNDLCTDTIDAQNDHRPVTIISNLIKYISNHISEDITLEQLAKESNFSSCYLCRIFKKYTGCTMTKYIISKRIDYVKNLLKQNCTISEACEQAGFNNYSYFYKVFKKSTGVSPTEYVAQINTPKVQLNPADADNTIPS